MQAESLEVLEKASVEPAQARAIVRAIEIEIAGAKDALATKQASDVQRAESRGEMSSLGAQLRGEMAALASELRGEMKQLARELRGEMAQLSAELRGEMKQLASELRGEMAELAAELRTEIAERLGDVRAEIAGVARQMYVAMLGQTAVLLGFFYFFFQLR